MGVLNAAVVTDDSRTVISNVIMVVEFTSWKSERERERERERIILIYDIYK